MIQNYYSFFLQKKINHDFIFLVAIMTGSTDNFDMQFSLQVAVAYAFFHAYDFMGKFPSLSSQITGTKWVVKISLRTKTSIKT